MEGICYNSGINRPCSNCVVRKTLCEVETTFLPDGMGSCPGGEGIWWGPAVNLALPSIALIQNLSCRRERFGKTKIQVIFLLPTHPSRWDSEGRSSQKLELPGQLQMQPKEGSLSTWRTSHLGEVWTCNYHALTHLRRSHSCLSCCFIIPVPFHVPFLLIFPSTQCFPPKYRPCPWRYHQPEVCSLSRAHVCALKPIQESLFLACRDSMLFAASCSSDSSRPAFWVDGNV